uniref:Uncharacterized protein n=1 Tax=Magallana gigas TaxID=29159 RepID=A0A8W8LGX0_MAGGI
MPHTKNALEKRNTDIKVDPNKETSNYTTIKEQQEHTERNMYDELAPNENASQYEDILKKENYMKNCKKVLIMMEKERPSRK